MYLKIPKETLKPKNQKYKSFIKRNHARARAVFFVTFNNMTILISLVAIISIVVAT